MHLFGVQSISTQIDDPMVERKNQRITVTLDTEDIEALEKMAERLEVSVAWIARRAIRGLVQQYQSSADVDIRMVFTEREDDDIPF